MFSLFNLLVAKFFILKSRLFSTQIGTKASEKEPLTKFSIVIILVLDVFLFGLIYDGISKQSEIVSTPESYASYRCRDTIDTFQNIDRAEFQKSAVEKLYNSSSYSRSSGYSSSYYSYDYGNTVDTSLECNNIKVLLTKTDSDTSLQELYRMRYIILNNITTNETQANGLRNNYDTKLFEKIAGQDPNLAIDPGTAATTKNNLDRLATEKIELDQQLAKNTKAILENPQVIEIVNLVKTSGIQVMDTYEQLVFWYPVKVLGVQILFLIPLLFAVGFWSNRSLMRGRPYQLLMASHLLAILGIFISLKLLEFIYDILPHKLIATVIDWLTSIQLVGIWYYLLIAFSVSIALGIVYFIQRRVKIASENRKAEISAKRAEKSQCWSCGAGLVLGATHCIRCGVGQYDKCASCKKDTLRAGEHCMHCGSNI